VKRRPAIFESADPSPGGDEIIRCPWCGSGRTAPSRLRLSDIPQIFFNMKPRRCLSCWNRFYIERELEFSSPTVPRAAVSSATVPRAAVPDPVVPDVEIPRVKRPPRFKIPRIKVKIVIRPYRRPAKT
jgi:hypothetical protein